MQHKELAISITTLDDSPVITLNGPINMWHAQTVEDILEGYVDEDAVALTIDMTQAAVLNAESISLLIRTLRIACNEKNLTVIAGNSIIPMLKMAGLDSNMRICSKIDQSAESSRKEPAYLTSRWMAQEAEERSEDEKLRLVA
jgi:anti-anti-sigma regulatory factor